MKRSFPAALACAAIALLAHLSARADGLVARSAGVAQGRLGAGAGRQAVVADGQGNAAGLTPYALTTESGAYGARSAKFNRSAEGSASASGQAQIDGANGSAQRSASSTRSANGSASAQRSATATNEQTKSLDASTSDPKGEGVSVRYRARTPQATRSHAAVDRTGLIAQEQHHEPGLEPQWRDAAA